MLVYKSIDALLLILFSLDEFIIQYILGHRHRLEQHAVPSLLRDYPTDIEVLQGRSLARRVLFRGLIPVHGQDPFPLPDGTNHGAQIAKVYTHESGHVPSAFTGLYCIVLTFPQKRVSSRFSNRGFVFRSPQRLRGKRGGDKDRRRYDRSASVERRR